LSVADRIELLLAVLLLAPILLWKPWLRSWAQRLAVSPRVAIALLAALPVVLRLLLLAHHPAPHPIVYDEFSHLLEADTLRHLRLANPPHALPQFFETFFVLQEPTYASIYPPGQGLVLAFGWTLFGHPWAGVLLAAAAFSAGCYWMLRGWTTPGWALVGGLLAAVEFGPLNQWMNDYWGGMSTAAAGAAVFGALPRLQAQPRQRDMIILALGLALSLITRPYESIFLFSSAAIYLFPAALRRKPGTVPSRPNPFSNSMGGGGLSPLEPRRALWKSVPELAMILMAAAALLLFQNKAVTGSWSTMPEVLSQYQYGVPAAFTWQPHVTPHRALTPQQELDYRMQRGFRGERPETAASFVERLEFRVRYYRFFFLPPLYLALVAFLARLKRPRFLWVAGTLALFALGVNFFPAFQLHYLAPVTCLFVLVSVVGLETIARRWAYLARWIVFLCAGQFLFWYAVHAFFDGSPLAQYETWDSIPHDVPDRRTFVSRQLDRIPGKLLVFVHYSDHHIFQDEWVYNAADIDHARIVFARDLGREDNAQLLAYYPDRQIWLLDPDDRPPSLVPYSNSEAVP